MSSSLEEKKTYFINPFTEKFSLLHSVVIYYSYMSPKQTHMHKQDPHTLMERCATFNLVPCSKETQQPSGGELAPHSYRSTHFIDWFMQILSCPPSCAQAKSLQTEQNFNILTIVNTKTLIWWMSAVSFLFYSHLRHCSRSLTLISTLWSLSFQTYEMHWNKYNNETKSSAVSDVLHTTEANLKKQFPDGQWYFSQS